VELEYWPVGVADEDSSVGVGIEEVFDDDDDDDGDDDDDDDEGEVFIEVFVRDDILIVAVDILLTAANEDEVEVLVDDDTVAVFANIFVNDNDMEGLMATVAITAVALLRTGEVDADAEGGMMSKPSMLIE
jgi:hypothetical protein